MSAQTHSPGPIQIYEANYADDEAVVARFRELVAGTMWAHQAMFELVDAEGLCVAITGLGPRSGGNARRIAAVLNARAGVSTEWLEQNAGSIALLGEPISNHFRELEQQREQLVAVARDFDEALGELGLHCECGEPDCRTTRLRAALAAGGAA